ncbi:unnamed protein product [Effrenium voratum]|nr:unnamed protein product [Effrenium voratum]
MESRSEPQPAAKVPSRLLHFDGARAIFAMWIVCHHMAPREPKSCLDAMMVRVDVCVEFFILLSGFLTHYLNSDKDVASTSGSFIAYFIRRIFRCLLATYVGMVLCVLTQLLGGFNVWTTKTLSCFLLLKTWIDPMPNCPNMPSWFVVSLLPCWLVYPCVGYLLRGSSTKFQLCLALASWSAAIGPQLCILCVQKSWLHWGQVAFTWFWPPALMPDFVLGACMAAMVRHNPPSKQVAWFGDIAMLVIVLACMLVPVPVPPPDWAGPSQWRPGHYIAWEQLFARLSAPFLCVFLYCTHHGDTLATRLLSHKTLVSLGRYTLEVYLLQMPLHDFFLWTRAPGAQGLWRGLPWTPEVFWCYLLVLWTTCGLFVEFVAEPLNQRVRAVSSSWVGRTLWEARILFFLLTFCPSCPGRNFAPTSDTTH